MKPLMNPVDWEEIFKPLIDHITGDLKQNNHGPGVSLFTLETLADLKRLMNNVNLDYRNYWQYVVHDGSQESFLGAFNISINHEDAFDCIQPLIDNVNDDILDFGDFSSGCFFIALNVYGGMSYNTIGEFMEDLKESHSKLKMLDCDFTILVEMHQESYLLDKNDPSSMFEEYSDTLGNFDTKHIKVTIVLYNKETLQVDITEDMINNTVLSFS